MADSGSGKGRPISAATLDHVRGKLGLPVTASHAEVLARVEEIVKRQQQAAPPRIAQAAPINQVIDLCRELGVGTAEVRASGRAITLDNIRATAAEKRAAAAAAPAAPAKPVRRVAAAPTHDPRHVQLAAAAAPAGAGDHYSLNPYVAQARAEHPWAYTDAVAANADLPTLFSSGDLPAFCSSGIDPSELLRVPWYARHAVAAAPTLAAAAELDGCLRRQRRNLSRAG